LAPSATVGGAISRSRAGRAARAAFSFRLVTSQEIHGTPRRGTGEDDAGAAAAAASLSKEPGMIFAAIVLTLTTVIALLAVAR
jgi:hypothetical protein